MDVIQCDKGKLQLETRVIPVLNCLLLRGTFMLSMQYIGCLIQIRVLQGQKKKSCFKTYMFKYKQPTKTIWVWLAILQYHGREAFVFVTSGEARTFQSRDCGDDLLSILRHGCAYILRSDFSVHQDNKSEMKIQADVPADQFVAWYCSQVIRSQEVTKNSEFYDVILHRGSALQHLQQQWYPCAPFLRRYHTSFFTTTSLRASLLSMGGDY
ncbi:hypothetical protein F2Q68_00044248 [Brassica cretica]|uniref:Uncharacterized protein n=1 Tax=Brassica cretica TaxID=69181 RepID=A0A8S9LMV0_BRACR|nr:hypothetical protein F2Q68_00044248 [Brassica cretica]